ncbi:MBL fold metallo-hydrolase [Christiangramia fulva]|uniref:MBL fold metallo-hydrolase n=1 Tax=Christiangramia fulva TaxID=2126553 RepID=A0A2R3Z701_9FLAO|nr:MBL fold metallo-hydrolase [Christiangramia fulva]AVR46063.1 MBL fold metallo-hydrolase [Christiangramia fulva]
MLKRFGKLPSGERQARIQKTTLYRDGEFKNLEETSINPDGVSMVKMLRMMKNRPSSVRPSEELPHQKTNLSAIESGKPAVVWFGHSSYFIKTKNLNILVDPVFSGFASPFSFFGKAFDGADEYNPDDMPEIDLLILTHDHYDHLDYQTIVELKPKVKKVVTSLGVGSHLEFWGYRPEIITEIVWWQSAEIATDVKITATPSRHFSGRGLTRFKTLWSSFVLEVDGFKIYLGGDSGYSRAFKEIGEKFENFDLALLECGQYNEYWPQIHMMPEQTAQVARDLNAKILMPVHWGKFVLSAHPWDEPVRRVTSACSKMGQKYVIPKIGEMYRLNEKFTQYTWWEEIK